MHILPQFRPVHLVSHQRVCFAASLCSPPSLHLQQIAIHSSVSICPDNLDVQISEGQLAADRQPAEFFATSNAVAAIESAAAKATSLAARMRRRRLPLPPPNTAADAGGRARPGPRESLPIPAASAPESRRRPPGSALRYFFNHSLLGRFNRWSALHFAARVSCCHLSTLCSACRRGPSRSCHLCSDGRQARGR